MIKKKDIKEFENLIEKVNDLMIEIKKYNPEATVYVAGEGVNLMNSNTHDRNGDAMPENIVTQRNIFGAEGGDW